MSIDWKNVESSQKALRSLEDRKILFKDIIEETSETSSFWLLIADVDAFKELKEKNLLNKEDFREMFKHLKTSDDLDNFSELYNNFYTLNIEFFDDDTKFFKILRDILERDVIKFNEFTKKIASIQNADETRMSYLERLLIKELDFKYLIENNLIFDEGYRLLFDSIQTADELFRFGNNSCVFTHTLKSKAVSFREVIDKHLSIKDDEQSSCLYLLFRKDEEFKELLKNRLISTKDCEYLLNEVTALCEMRTMRNNTSLLRYCFKNFLIDKELVEKFNKLVTYINFFGYLKEWHQANEPFTKLVDDYEQFGVSISALNYTDQEKQELFEICKKSKSAQKTLRQVVDSNLKVQYTFDQLKELITKDDNRKKMKLSL